MEQGSCKGCAGGVLAFIVGGLVGAGASLLFAPQSGKETRKQIRNVADSVVDTTENYYEQIKKSVVSALEDGQEIFADKKERIMNAVKAGIEVYEKKQDADDTSDSGEATIEDTPGHCATLAQDVIRPSTSLSIAGAA